MLRFSPEKSGFWPGYFAGVILRERRRTLWLFFLQNGTENDEKATPGRPKSRPWSEHGSDALSGAPVCVWRGGLFPTFRSIFGDLFAPLFADISETTFLMKKVVFLKTSVSPRREHHF